MLSNYRCNQAHNNNNNNKYGIVIVIPTFNHKKDTCEIKLFIELVCVKTKAKILITERKPPSTILKLFHFLIKVSLYELLVCFESFPIRISFMTKQSFIENKISPEAIIFTANAI